jgi:DNA-binding NtrC family response regulator
MRAVILEDSIEDLALIILRLHRAGIVLKWRAVTTEGELRQALIQFSPEVVLSGVNNSGYFGIQALQFVRASFPEVPFIFVSRALSEDRAQDLIAQGATDCVPKRNMDRLADAVIRANREARGRKAEAER